MHPCYIARDRASEIEMMGSQYFQCLTESHSIEASTMVIRCYELVIFFFFLKRWSESWEPFTVLKSGRFNCGSNGFVLFMHRMVLVVKRTALVRGSRLFRSDRTVRSESENHAYNPIYIFTRFQSSHITCIKKNE